MRSPRAADAHDREQRRAVRGRQQLLQRELGHRAVVDRRPRRTRAAVQRPVVLVVPLQDGRGSPPLDDDDPERGLLFRLSVPGPDGTPRAARRTTAASCRIAPIIGVPAEGTHRDHHRRDQRHVRRRHAVLAARPDVLDRRPGLRPTPDDVMISPRVAPAGDRPRACSRPFPRPTSSRPPTPTTPTATASPAGRTALDRRRWRAAARSLRLEGQRALGRQQNAGAFLGDIGITSSLHPDQDCTAVADRMSQRDRTAATPRLDEPKLDRGHVLHAHARRAGAARRRRPGGCRRARHCSRAIGCASCHTPPLQHRRRPTSPRSPTRRSTRTPTCCCTTWATGLADGRPDFEASGTEWRTAPLWGIGLVDDRQRPHAVPARRPRPRPRPRRSCGTAARLHRRRSVSATSVPTTAPR